MTSSASALPSDGEPCPGCGLVYPRSDGPTHAYIGASAGCWARYGELLAVEYSEARLFRWHRFTVNAYAAQHPVVPQRRSAQSVHVHLTALYLMLERGVDPAAVKRTMQLMADGRTFPWLEPPELATKVGLPQVLAAAAGDDYGSTARCWAEAVWRAWAPHHGTIRDEAERALTSH